MYSVYILRCADGTLYTGITTDIDRRIKQHQSGNGSKYVKTRRPVKLVHMEDAPDRSSALKRELQIKAMSRPQKLAMIKRI